MELHPVSYYVRELKPKLPATVLKSAASRLWWLPFHVGVAAIATVAIAREWVPWWLVPVLSLAIGLSFASLMFLGHETLHGALTRGRWRWANPIIGWICFAPLTLSQRLWVVWHNQVHHANTNKPGADPDMYPTLDAYRSSRLTRWGTDNFALGGGRIRGLLSLLFGFVGQRACCFLRAVGCGFRSATMPSLFLRQRFHWHFGAP